MDADDRRRRDSALRRVAHARHFPANTNPCSRHAEIIGAQLVRGKPYPTLTEEPLRCGESILLTVAGLYEARSALAELFRVCELESTVGVDGREWNAAMSAARRLLKGRTKAERAAIAAAEEALQ